MDFLRAIGYIRLSPDSIVGIPPTPQKGFDNESHGVAAVSTRFDIG